MRKQLQNHGGKERIAPRIIAVAMGMVLTFGVIFGFIAQSTKSKISGNLPVETQISLVRTSVSEAVAEDTYKLTATATFQWKPAVYEFVWSAAFKDPESEWATGKNAEQYVGITPSGTHKETAVVSCLVAFSEPIVITVQIRCNGILNNSVKATCKCDCEMRAEVEFLEFSQDYVTKIVTFAIDVEGTCGSSDIAYEVKMTDFVMWDKDKEKEYKEDLILPFTIFSGYLDIKDGVAEICFTTTDLFMAFYYLDPQLLYDKNFSVDLLNDISLEIELKLKDRADEDDPGEVIYTKEKMHVYKFFR